MDDKSKIKAAVGYADVFIDGLEVAIATGLPIPPDAQQLYEEMVDARKFLLQAESRVSTS